MPPRDARAVERDLARFISHIAGSIAIEVTKALRDDTPKDTEFAASNYVPSIGAPVSSTVGVRNHSGGVTYGPQEAGLARLETYDVRQGNIYIGNNVDYLPLLNGGSSMQAPAGFIQVAILKGIGRGVRRAVR